MPKNTHISWTDHSWNPWQGCKPVALPCDNCYAKAQMTFYRKDFFNVRRSAPHTFNLPLRLPKEPAKVFVCSWSDFFIEQAAPWRAEAWEIMLRTPHLTYQVPTKRPGLAVAWYKEHGWLPNVWLGTSVGQRKYLPWITVLSRVVEAPVIWVSFEPLLEDLDWARSIRDQCHQAGVAFFHKQGSAYEPDQHRLLDGRLWEEFPAARTA